METMSTMLTGTLCTCFCIVIRSRATECVEKVKLKKNKNILCEV